MSFQYQEAERRRELGEEWIKIHHAVVRNAEVRALYREYLRQYPEPTHGQALLIRREMMDVLEEMDGHRGV